MIALLLSLALAVDLDTARDRATDAAIGVATAQAQASAARGNAWVSASGALPSVELFAAASSGAGLTSFGFERPVANQASFGVTGSWTLINPAAWASADAARHTVRGRRAMLDWARVTARRDATVAIADLWESIGVRDALDTATTDAERAAAAVESLADSGLRPPSEAARSRAAAAALRAQLTAAEGQVAGRCAALQALLRDAVDGQCTLDEPAVGQPQDGLSDHPAVVAAREALAAAKAQRASQGTVGRLPTLGATGTAGHYYAGGNDGFGWSAGLQASLPIVSGGALIGQAQSATAARDEAELALEDQQLQLTSAGVAAQSTWVAASASVDALELSLDAAEEALRLTDSRYRQGLDSLEAWLAARRVRDDAAVALASGRAAHLRALAELESVRGVY